MTQERLRELMRERVADEAMPDYAERAWHAARRVRRRHRLGAAAGVVAATVGISAGIVAVNSTPPASNPTPGRPAPLVTTPDATYQGVPVWWSPDQQQEQELARADSPLPPTIDLDTSRPYVPGELDRAVAAFARGLSVVLVGPDGQLRTVDVSRLKKVIKPNGYAYFPVSTGMLSGEGSWLAFRQPGDRAALFTIGTGEWTDVDLAGDRQDEEPTPDPGFDAAAAQRYGEVRGGAASWGMGVPLPVRDGARYLSDPEFLATDGAVLAFMDRFSSGQDNRYKQCCPVAGWLDDQTVVYESRQTRALLVAWRVGTDRFGLVSRIQGTYDVASFAF